MYAGVNSACRGDGNTQDNWDHFSSVKKPTPAEHWSTDRPSTSRPRAAETVDKHSSWVDRKSQRTTDWDDRKSSQLQSGDDGKNYKQPKVEASENWEDTTDFTREQPTSLAGVLG